MKTQCVYCSREIATTKDHIPPKALFPQPRPSNLITVPCCRTCNEGFSKDDTYLRDTLCLRQEMADNPAVSKLLQTVVRSIAGKGREGYLKHILSRFSERVAATPAGIIIGNWPTLKVDLERLRKTCARIVLGLFYSHTGRPLDSEYAIRVYPLEYVESLWTEHFNLFHDVLMKPLQSQEFVTKGEYVFKYRHLSDQSDENATAWQLTFYEKYPVFAVTLQADKIPPEKVLPFDYPPIWRF